MPKNVLVADDSLTIRKVIGMIFATEDFQVTSVDNGLEAISKTREQRPDLVLADVTMPGRNGYEVCEALKSDPATQQIPVILLAGTFEPFDEARAQAVGADAHLTKPFESQALLDKVRGLLGLPVTAPIKTGFTTIGTAGAAAAAAAAPAPAPAATPKAPVTAPAAARPVAAPMRPAPMPAGPGAPMAGQAVTRPGMPAMGPSGGPAPRPGMPAPMPGRPGGPSAMPMRPGMPGGPGPASVPMGARPGMPPPGAPLPRPGMATPVPSRPGIPAAPGVVPGRPGMPVPGHPGMAAGFPRPPGAQTLPGIPARGRDPYGLGPPSPARPLVPGEPSGVVGDARPQMPVGAGAMAKDAGASSLAPGAPVRSPSSDGGEAQLREALSKASREVIEKIAWEVVPQLAETIIREELERLIKEREAKS